MPVATSIPCLRVPGPTTSTSAATSSTAPSTSCCFRLATRSRSHYAMTVMNSQAEGPLRRPVAPPPPPLTPPSPPSPMKPVAPSPPPPQQTSGAAAEVGAAGKGVVTVEFQRQKAKEIQEYFKQKKLEEASQGPFFGFLPKNEISNGRWAMFGFAVGMLTEYATGSDFVDQVKILLSNFGILDLE